VKYARQRPRMARGQGNTSEESVERVSKIAVRRKCLRSAVVHLLFLLFIGLVVYVPSVRAADNDDDYDSYKLRLDAFWFYAQPTGTFSGTRGNGSFDLQADVAFQSYSTFTGRVDWKFTRKNHLFFAVTPFSHSKSFVAARTITFQGQTFDVGVSASADLQVNAYAPGYQYDIIRRKRGHLGIQAQLDIFDVQGTVSAASQVTNGVPRVSQRAQGSLRAPLPVAGPDVRLYLLPHSSRLFVTGNLLGMYFFGYGNFLSTIDTVGLTVNKHISARAGYQLGTRLNVNSKDNRIGLNLTQKGPVVGAEFSF
jgi:hypothetical protein